jgi:hypothetical protein
MRIHTALRDHVVVTLTGLVLAVLAFANRDMSGSIVGHVLDPDGQPREGVTVHPGNNLTGFPASRNTLARGSEF